MSCSNKVKYHNFRSCGEKVYGIDLALYKVSALRGRKRVATVAVFAHTKFEALVEAEKYFPQHNGYDYRHVRFATSLEMPGVLLHKNDKKRKK